MEVPDAERETLLVLYQTCFARYQSNTSLQWQIYAFMLASQGALLAAAVAAARLGSLIAGIAAPVLALLGVILSQRLEMTEWWDRFKLDELENQLLPQKTGLRLYHGKNAAERAMTTETRNFRAKYGSGLRNLEYKIVGKAHPSLVMLIVMSLMSATCLSIGISRFV